MNTNPNDAKCACGKWDYCQHYPTAAMANEEWGMQAAMGIAQKHWPPRYGGCHKEDRKASFPIDVPAPTTEAVVADQSLKKDAEKVPTHLLPTAPLVEISKVLGFGAKKYARHGWRAGMDWSRVYGAILRHLFAWEQGEDLDPETGLPHLAHAGCEVLFLLEYAKRGLGKDDRFKLPAATEEDRKS